MRMFANNSLPNKRQNRLMPMLGDLMDIIAPQPQATPPFVPTSQIPNAGQMPPMGRAERLMPPISQNYLDGTPPAQNPVVGASQVLTPDTFDGRNPQSMIPMPTATPTGAVSPVLAEQLPSQATQGLINEVNSRDYSKARFDEQGNLIKPAGKDRDKKWSLGEKIGGTLLGALQGFGQGGIGGAIAGGVLGGSNRNFMEQQADAQRMARLMPQLEQQQQAEEFGLNQETRQIANKNILDDNAQKTREFDERMAYNKSEQERKIGDRTSRETTARMRGVMEILKGLPSYDPNDPKFAELTKALGDVKLPITTKDAKKKVDLKQDQRTGAWEAVVTDTTGAVETRPVLQKDGTQLKTTPTVVMQGEYGMLKQDDQQMFTQGENEKDRAARAQLAANAESLRLKMAEYTNLQKQIASETDFNRRQQLQTQAEAARQEGIILQKSLSGKK